MTTPQHTLQFRMTSIRLIRSLAVCSLMLALHPIAAAPASPEKTGLAVGQKAPGFTLKDQDDREVSRRVTQERPGRARLLPIGRLVTLLPKAVGSTAIRSR
ncbi:MAG: hypothetical protein M3Q46_03355 [Verrucomicrobiota bacterium]|nr:hypothetical protein [Verrucomicrobiota bacterium]